MPHAHVVGIPHLLGERPCRRVASVERDDARIRLERRNLHPHRRDAVRVPRVDLVRNEVAGGVREPEVAAVRETEVGVAEPADRRGELHEHREVRECRAGIAGDGDVHRLGVVGCGELVGIAVAIVRQLVEHNRRQCSRRFVGIARSQVLLGDGQIARNRHRRRLPVLGNVDMLICRPVSVLSEIFVVGADSVVRQRFGIVVAAPVWRAEHNDDLVAVLLHRVKFREERVERLRDVAARVLDPVRRDDVDSHDLDPRARRLLLEVGADRVDVRERAAHAEVELT